MRAMGNSITFKNLPSITECDAFLRQQNLSYGKSGQGTGEYCPESSSAGNLQKKDRNCFLQ